MIIYKNILEKLKNAGYSAYRIRKENLLSEGTLQRIRDGRPITTDTIDTICSLLHCDVEEILQYKEE